ncbi:MAG: methylated-DNA--[protein]-cysteine S-methyltransferase [Pirellulales bacterium]
MAASCERLQLFPTPLGWMAIAGRDDVLQGVSFGYATRREAQAAAEKRWGGRLVAGDWNDDLRNRLTEYAGGKPTELCDVLLGNQDLSPFQRAVLAHCRQIGWGRTLTYGQLAQRAGFPGAARAVGSVRASNRYPLVVPCHRVIAAGGGLGGYSARDGIGMKWRLLRLERAEVARKIPRPTPVPI